MDEGMDLRKAFQATYDDPPELTKLSEPDLIILLCVSHSIKPDMSNAYATQLRQRYINFAMEQWKNRDRNGAGNDN